MSDGIEPQPDAAQRITVLENQVKGLMETMSMLHQLYGLAALKIPKPDQYVNGKGGAVAAEQQDGFATDEDSLDDEQSIQGLFEEAEDGSIGMATAEPGPVEQSKPCFAAEDVPNLPQYTYSPLSVEASEIRLLALDISGSAEDPISCRLITTSLDDAPEYPEMYKSSPIECFTPLSYCWGEASFTEYIVVDGHAFLVTPSLHAALLHARKAVKPPENSFGQGSKTETYWWIDAICINQNDVAERNSQVGLMTRLYRAAHMVHVWLGDESDNSSQAMELIRDLAYLPSSPDDIESWNYIPKTAGQTHRPDGPGRRMKKLPTHDTTVLSEEQKSENYAALISFYRRPWFSRVWIRQEIALPEQVTFHCGDETCNWKDVMRTADILTYLADEYHLPTLQHEDLRADEAFGSCFRKALGLYELREEMSLQRDTYGELQALALKGRDCQATDPRDKVFAMLPLTNPDETDVQADYNKDKVEVYKETTLSLLRTNLDYLSGCQNPTRSNGLPSWVPDLEAPSKPHLTETDYGHDKNLEDHWGNPPDDVVDFEYVSEEARLDIQGVIFDKIRDIDEDNHIEANSSNDEVRITSQQWRQFYESRRDALFERWEEEENWEGRDECLAMFDIPFDESGWQWQVLRNSDVDTYRAGDDGGVRFKRWDDDTVDHDPTLKRVKRLLPSDDTPFSEVLGREDQYFAYIRPLAVGRKMFFSSKGAIGLIPAEAEAGDAICFFDGCGCPFVIRKQGNDTWVIVGQAYYFGRIVLYRARAQPLQKTVIRVV